MQEFMFEIVPGNIRGLVPNPLYPPQADYASSLRNLRPAEYAAVNPEWFTAPFTFTLDWPFPQILRGENGTWLLGRTGVSTFSGWTPAADTVYQSTAMSTEATVTGGTSWQTANFEDVWFATNGASLLFRIPAYAKTLAAQGITVQSLCAHDDRLILAGLAGGWFSGDRWQRLFKRWRQTQPAFSHDQQSWSTRWVVWGERFGGAKDIPFYTLLAALGVFGNAAFDAFEAELITRIERGELGFSSVRQNGVPVAMKPLGDRVMLYSTEGRAALVPDSSRYVVVQAPGAGVAARAALSGDRYAHAWLAPSGALWSDSGDGAKDYDLAWCFPAPTTVVASFDPVEREHWFSTSSSAYVWNQYGLGGPLDVCPTSLARVNGALVGPGAGLSASSLTVEFYTHQHDLRYRGSKRINTLEWVTSGMSGLLADVKSGPLFFSLGPVQCNQHGVGCPRRSGNEFQIGMKGTASVGASYAVQRCAVRYQSEDRSFRRGASIAADDAG